VHKVGGAATVDHGGADDIGTLFQAQSFRNAVVDYRPLVTEFHASFNIRYLQHIPFLRSVNIRADSYF
jgi:hypothetical protein